MSTLNISQMLEEALGPIDQRIKSINEQHQINQELGFLENCDPSFEFVASDGNTLGVKFFYTTDPGASGAATDASGPQEYNIVTTTGHIIRYPCLTTGRGDVIFVHDPTAVCASRVIEGDQRYIDPQEWWQGDGRPLKDKSAEHVPRPMNAFIIYRNAHMASVRQQHPGIGNNDVSRIIGKKWRTLDPESRAHYKNLANRSAQEHHAKHPGYKYTPRKPEDVMRRRKRPDSKRPSFHRSPRVHLGGDSIDQPSISLDNPTPVLPSLDEFTSTWIKEPTAHNFDQPSISLNNPIPGLPDLNELTNSWIKEPTAHNFDALMNGFDCALELAAVKSP